MIKMQRVIFFFALDKDINTLSRKHNLKLKTLKENLSLAGKTKTRGLKLVLVVTPDCLL